MKKIYLLSIFILTTIAMQAMHRENLMLYIPLLNASEGKDPYITQALIMLKKGPYDASLLDEVRVLVKDKIYVPTTNQNLRIQILELIREDLQRLQQKQPTPLSKGK